MTDNAVVVLLVICSYILGNYVGKVSTMDSYIRRFRMQRMCNGCLYSEITDKDCLPICSRKRMDATDPFEACEKEYNFKSKENE